ncbi:hypothetical protein H0H87_007148 [Tephrocybe sp. NHM501043]|nr:hypothetical protein H0H87_007148 [Tephrocybe sp. NHM501043]
MLNARERGDDGASSKYEQEASKGTPLRVHLHTTSYTSPITPTTPPSALLSKEAPSANADKTYPWE